MLRLNEIKLPLDHDAAALPAAIVERLNIDAGDLNSDMHATAEYRAHLVMVMARRAVAAACA